eukprot:scaffold38142_cov27-Tisochrysis_lutea.AAC.4
MSAQSSKAGQRTWSARFMRSHLLSTRLKPPFPGPVFGPTESGSLGLDALTAEPGGTTSRFSTAIRREDRERAGAGAVGAVDAVRCSLFSHAL